MPTLNSSRIKTLSKAIAEAKQRGINGASSPKSPEIIRLNRKLREAFGILALPKNTPLPQFENKKKREGAAFEIKEKNQNEKISIAERIKGGGFGLKNAGTKQKKSTELERQRLEAERAKKAAEEMERQKEAAQKAEEERAKQEKERQEAEEKMAANDLQKVLQILIAKLRKKKEALGKEAAAVPGQKSPLEQKRRLLESKVAMIKNSELATIEEKEQIIEKRGSSAKEELKNNSDPQKEKILKQKIWKIEDERKEIEKQRWAIEDRINKVIAESQKIETEINAKNSLLKEIEQKINDANGHEITIRFVAEKRKAEEEILKIIAEKEVLFPDLSAAEDKKINAEKELSLLSEEELSASSRLNAIENQEAQTLDPAKKREVEQSRWEAGNNLKSIVEKKWAGEEKLKQAAAQLRFVQEKIKDFNSKIDAVQNKITAAQISLEKDGLPVRALRDAVCRLLEENNVNFNPAILADIVQLEEKPAEKTPATTTQDRQGKNKQKEADLTENKERESDAKDLKTRQESAPEIKSPDKETPEDLQAQEAKKTTQDNQKKEAADVPDKATEKMPQANTQTAAKSQINNADLPEARKEKPKTDNRQETKNDTALKPAPKMAKNIIPSADDAAKMAAQNGAVYREQVEKTPAKNIRVFAPETLSENNAAPGIKNKKTAEGDVVTAKKEEKEPPKQEEESMPAAANLESRWQQIKKTTVPTASAVAAGGAAQVAAIQPQPAFDPPADKSGKNKFLARMVVILALAGVLAIALIIIMSKNGDAPVVKKPAVIETPLKPEPQIPAEPQSILSAISPVTIYTDDPANIPNLISPYLRKKFDANGYYQLIIINRANNKKIGLKQFFSIYKISAPSVFHNSIGDECEFFIFANNGKNRIGFVSPIVNAELIETAMSGWEGSIAKDTENFFRLLGQKAGAGGNAAKFTATGGAGTSYKLMNFSPAEDEFAIAWANYQQKYFVFSTSNNSMSGIFSRLPK